MSPPDDALGSLPQGFAHGALADLPGVAFAAMRQIILAQAKSSDLKVLEDMEGCLTVETAHGVIGLRPGREAETAGMVAAQDPRWLFVMKNAVISQMQHLMPEVAEAMRWSDGDRAGSLPPNFQFVRVAEIEELGEVFYRVTLEGEDLTTYTDAAIHFRLVQPPTDAEPAWPAVAPNGSTTWPEGPGAPHNPVYTARSVDHGAKTLVTDVFIHEGGRTTEWVRELQRGERGRRVIGLMGPAGGGLLAADRVLMATDETGFPAAARLLENLPDGATGEVLLEAENGAACAYPIEVPPGFRLRWLSRAEGDHLGNATVAAMADHEGAQIWFAGEKQQARQVREAAKAAGWPSKGLRISGFWSAP
ncbi:MAG: siderophore-interacting protein [Pseudomonadota bacterium]